MLYMIVDDRYIFQYKYHNPTQFRKTIYVLKGFDISDIK